MDTEPFSCQLERWLRSDGSQTIGRLGEVFAHKSFAIAIVALMSFSALPLPTGGITVVFECVSAFLGAQMLLGARTIWLPAAWRDRRLGDVATAKAMPFVVRRIRWFERFTRPRGVVLLTSRSFNRVLGLLVISFAIAAALAVPFSGLDTLPSIGAVVLCLGVLLDDILVVAVGAAIGSAGVLVTLTLGSAILRFVGGLF